MNEYECLGTRTLRVYEQILYTVCDTYNIRLWVFGWACVMFSVKILAFSPQFIYNASSGASLFFPLLTGKKTHTQNKKKDTY